MKRVDPARARVSAQHGVGDVAGLEGGGDIGSQIEIEAIRGGVKHVGIITQVIPTFSPQGEVYKFVSQTRPYLFGNPAGGAILKCRLKIAR